MFRLSIRVNLPYISTSHSTSVSEGPGICITTYLPYTLASHCILGTKPGGATPLYLEQMVLNGSSSLGVKSKDSYGKNSNV